MSASDDEEDLPKLSAETFSALQEFYREQEERETALRLIRPNAVYFENTFQEDWQLSQFWYDDRTTDILVNAAIKSVGPNAKIALVSCPTLYKNMKEKASEIDCEVTLFEYDRRFAIYGEDYILYDYNSPLSIPRNKSSYYDIVLADPPFLSEECLTKTAVTIKFLTKGRIILCTGAIMADLAQRLLDLKKATFEPQHKNNLANEFWCYTNFNMDELL